MLTLLEYILQLSACYAVLYTFYWLVLRRLTNYAGNRFYLLLSSAIAFAIPLLRLNIFISQQAISTSAFINYMPALNINETTNDRVSQTGFSSIPVTLIMVYISGVAICCSHFLMQLISLKKITANAVLISTINGVRLYQLDINVMPFSFGNSVYINMQKYTANELDDIIKHELVHAKQKHTIDILITEIICILNWYNPFAWLIKYAVKQNLEFIADDVTVKHSADKKNYQYLLLKVTGYSLINIVNSFKLSSLKQRIYMMNKKRTSARHLLKLFLLVPLIAVMMLAFRNNNTPALNNSIGDITKDTFMLSKLSYKITDTHIAEIVNETQDKSFLEVGKPFTLTSIVNEMDRLRVLLEKNGYNNIGAHSIRTSLDSTLDKHRFEVHVYIDLNKKELSLNNINKELNNVTADNRSAHLQTNNNQEKVLLSSVAQQKM